MPPRTVLAAILLLVLGICPVFGDAVWVFLVDKPGASGRPWPLPEGVSPGPGLDLDLDAGYVAQIVELGVALRQRSRWFNAVSVEATPEQIERLRRLHFVREVRPVRTFRRHPEPAAVAPAPRAAIADLEYGPSLAQAAAIGAPQLHGRGLLGQGVRVAVLDAGFNWREHRAFAGLGVIAARDFVNGDDEVGDETDEPVTGDEASNGQNEHGTRVLSVLAGDDPGSLIGIAPRAEYLLAKTEDTVRELPIQEDRWVPALEWADSLGARVINASLGYSEFDDGSGYTYDDLDGRTALSTRAAELAVARGIVVVAAAGNEGNKPWHYITVPADGPGVIAVGAVHPTSRSIGAFSSRGPTADGRIKPDVVAPGQQVIVVSGRGAGRNELPGQFAVQEYESVSGTSFAAPIASAACALLVQQHPDWSPAQVGDALRRTATDLGSAGPDTVFGWGLIDVARASGLEAAIPERGTAGAPYPNPARGPSPTVYFPLELARGQVISLSIFAASGSLVADVPPRALPPGTYAPPGLALAWKVPDDLASGVYWFRLDGESFHHLGRIAVLRSR